MAILTFNHNNGIIVLYGSGNEKKLLRRDMLQL